MNKLFSTLKTVLTYLILFKVLAMIIGCSPVGRSTSSATITPPPAPICTTCNPLPQPPADPVTINPPIPVLTPPAGLLCNLYDLSLSPPSMLPNFEPEASQAALNQGESVGPSIATWLMAEVIDFTTANAMQAGSGYSLETNYAMDCKGLFTASDTDIYDLSLNSDDGSQLLIDGASIILNDELHSAKSVSATVAITKGVHTVELQYFQGPGVAVLQLYSNLPMNFHQ